MINIRVKGYREDQTVEYFAKDLAKAHGRKVKDIKEVLIVPKRDWVCLLVYDHENNLISNCAF